jgi:hypothetical protein
MTEFVPVIGQSRCKSAVGTGGNHAHPFSGSPPTKGFSIVSNADEGIRVRARRRGKRLNKDTEKERKATAIVGTIF